MKKLLIILILFMTISVSAKFYKTEIIEDSIVLPEYSFYINNSNYNKIPNNNDYLFVKSSCNNKTISKWDDNKWIPVIENIESNDTICNYYFMEKVTKSLKDTDINKYISIDNNIYKIIDINTLEVEGNNLSKFITENNNKKYLDKNTYIEKGNGDINNPYIIRG